MGKDLHDRVLIPHILIKKHLRELANAPFNDVPGLLSCYQLKEVLVALSF